MRGLFHHSLNHWKVEDENEDRSGPEEATPGSSGERGEVEQDERGGDPGVFGIVLFASFPRCRWSKAKLPPTKNNTVKNSCKAEKEKERQRNNAK